LIFLENNAQNGATILLKEENNMTGKKKRPPKPLKVSVSESVSLSESTISVTASASGMDDREFYFPVTVSSPVITKTILDETGFSLKPKERKELLETVDIAKTYFSEFEIGFTFEEGFKFRVKREPKKIVKVVRSVKE
jgi:hypothetical protein